MTADHEHIILKDFDTAPKYVATGLSRALLSNRISYFFNLHGPSMTIDTACSSSLVALHQAVQSLRTGESTMSIVTGTNILSSPEVRHPISKGIPSDGIRCLLVRPISQCWALQARQRCGRKMQTVLLASSLSCMDTHVPKVILAEKALPLSF